MAAIYNSLLLLLESLRTESKHTITMEELSIVEGIAPAICDRINLKVFSGTYTKANTMNPSQHARLSSTPGENSLFQYGGKEGSTSQSRAPSQTPIVDLISSSPPGDMFHFLNFPESLFDKASQLRYGHRFGFGTSIDQNDGSTKGSSNDVKQGSRLLIDAYGGNDTSHEKLPKVQRLNAYQVKSGIGLSRSSHGGARILDGSYMTQELSFGVHNSEPNSNSETSTVSFASIAYPYVLLKMFDGSILLLV